MKLRLSAAGASFEISLNNSPTAKAVFEAAPFEGRASTWVVEPGTVCFWTEGDALALPYGRTPISTDERPKLASRCNVLGRLEGDPRALAKIRSGDRISVSSA